MKKFTILDKEGLMALLAGVIGIVVMLSLTGCSSLSLCNKLKGDEFRKCEEQRRLQEADKSMVRSGFYEAGSAKK